jgi:cytochrome oxidase assembly protein ShyY1
MSLKIGNRSFAPRAWAVALTAVLLAVFVSLGWWQVGRAREKQAMMESFARGTQTSVVLTGVGVDELPRYQHVSAQGHYEPDRQVLLDNMPSSTGQPGYRVLTPFRRGPGDKVLLVDRGWVPLGVSREQLPVVFVDPKPRTVAGRLDGLPVPGIRVGTAQAPGATGWPRVLNFPTQSDIEAVLGEKVESRIVLLDASNPDGYERVWRPSVGFPPERHLGYAIQWFALALTLIVIFVALSLKRDPNDQVQPR